jgi:hypothetical protein
MFNQQTVRETASFTDKRTWFAYKGRPAARPAEAPKAPALPKPSPAPATGAPEPAGPKPKEPAKKSH